MTSSDMTINKKPSESKTPKLTILVVDDEASIVTFITSVLEANHYRTLTAANGQEAKSLIASHCPDLVLLDLGLPDVDGLDILAAVRSWSSIPIIVISARTLEHDKVTALDLGADDYITKPFGTSELLARIRTALRHSRKAAGANDSSGIFTTGGLTIDFNKRKAIINGEEIHLTQIEFKIVALLASNCGKVLTYDTIIKEVWGPFASSNNQILRVNMANIRRKIEHNPAEPRYIFTEIGVGYRMADE